LWLSIRLLESRANDDIVVSEPQNPRATKREYLPSRFHCSDMITKIPKMKDPKILTISTLRGIVLNKRGDSVILNLKKAPTTEPTARNTNSRPFILYLQIFSFGTINATCFQSNIELSSLRLDNY